MRPDRSDGSPEGLQRVSDDARLVMCDTLCRLCGLQKTLRPSVDNAVLLVFGADHGITKDAAVSAYPREVNHWNLLHKPLYRTAPVRPKDRTPVS